MGGTFKREDIVYSIRMANLWKSANTDGILIKLFNPEDKEMIINICHEWEKRTHFELEFDEYTTVIQSNVNNYIIIDKDGNVKRKGAIVKKLNLLDNDLPIVNKAVVNYFVNNIPVEETILSSESLMDFQKITKISGKYDYGVHNGIILYEKVHRCFASKNESDGILYKKHKSKTTLDKTASTPEHCKIINDDVTELKLPTWLDKNWYIELAKKRIKEFVK